MQKKTIWTSSISHYAKVELDLQKSVMDTEQAMKTTIEATTDPQTALNHHTLIKKTIENTRKLGDPRHPEESQVEEICQTTTLRSHRKPQRQGKRKR